MAKVYEVTVPAHSGGGKFRVTAANEKRVKELLCKKLDRTRVPKGTVIKKIGLTKKKEETSEEPQEDSLKEKALKAAEEKKATKPKKKPVKALNPHEMKLYLEQKKEEKEKKEHEDCTFINGLYLKNEKKVKLRSKMDFSDASLFIMEDGAPKPCYVGEDCVLTIKRGTELWLYLDHTEDKVNEKELLNHI